MSKTTIAVLRNLIPGLDKGCKIVDAKKPMLVAPTKADAKNAQRLDPVGCLYANACKRKGKPAVVFREIAYVKESSKRVLKYTIPAAGRAQIIALDASGIAVAGASIKLMPPKGREKVGGSIGRKRGSVGKRLSKKELERRRATRNALPELRKTVKK
jgi:hypothetical protein